MENNFILLFYYRTAYSIVNGEGEGYKPYRYCGLVGRYILTYCTYMDGA
jgi:hypothetical protein